MKRIAFFVAAACFFGLVPFVGRLGPVVGSLALVGAAIAVALAASAAPAALGVASGALGAFAAGLLGTVSPFVAGAVLVCGFYAERTTRVRSVGGRVAHLAVAAASGGIAGLVMAAYSAAALPVLAVAVLVCSVLVGLPLLVDADDPFAHALGLAALDVPEPARASLREGAELRRHAREVPLDADTEARVRSTWRSLMNLAEARVRLSRTPAASGSPAEAVVKMVDDKIKDHVVALSRAYIAVDTARAAQLGLDDSALKGVETVGESLEEVSHAMAEIKS
jgi:MFS family permease